MTAGWGVRTIRAAVFASVCVLLAALGHVLMSGATVPWWTLAAGAVLTGGAGWCLAGRERGLPLVVSVVVVAQGGLHAAFEFAQSSSATAHGMGSMSMGMGSMDPMSMDSRASMSMGHIGMRHMDPGHMDTAHMGMGHMGMGHDMAGTSSFGMFAAHTLAALLCGLWLGHGERAAFRILRAVAGWLAAPLRLSLALPVPPHRPRLRPRRGRSDRAPRLLPLVHTITSRGPPAGIAVV
ncbi:MULTISPECIES: hypothetical protein [unclassified Streptomyces]|uniref:hypothetical protein n=1 Tax=unclassified Streptomyces TaxID=2593676 RepID=UPI0023669F59|nr:MULTISPECIES: hypothetical protein [unclassified Streptomyces]MDF3148231.1 hypothetical protein [Streptomyces sp. T21Q-yed]WDF36175.1 hypothetical protein PBV52_05020 [Streptomyces sp. T12]